MAHGESVNTTAIKPGVGIGEVKLRSSPDAIVALLGSPSRKDTLGDEEMWSFADRNLTLVFERDGPQQQLVSIESRDPATHIANMQLVDRQKHELAALFHIRGFGQPTSETDGVVEDLTFPEAGLVLSFFEGRVEEVSVEVAARSLGKARDRSIAPPPAAEPAAGKAKAGCFSLVAVLAGILVIFTLL